MSLIVELRFRSPALALGPTLESEPAVTLDAVGEAATDPDRPYLYFWVEGPDRTTVQAALEDDPTVAAADCYAEFDDRALYRIQVSEATEVVSYGAWVEAGVAILDATWRDGWWHARMRFPDREALGDVTDWLEERDVSVCLDRIFEDHGQRRTGVDLTPEQRQVLLTARELGYFEIPRDASMADIADALDISSQAVSERLRRGYSRLVRQAVH